LRYINVLNNNNNNNMKPQHNNSTGAQTCSGHSVAFEYVYKVAQKFGTIFCMLNFIKY